METIFISSSLHSLWQYLNWFLPHFNFYIHFLCWSKLLVQQVTCWRFEMADTASLHFILGISVLAASIIFSIVYSIYSFVFAPKRESVPPLLSVPLITLTDNLSLAAVEEENESDDEWWENYSQQFTHVFHWILGDEKTILKNSFVGFLCYC